MNIRTLVSGIAASIALTAGIVALASAHQPPAADDDDDKAAIIALGEAPAAVRTAIQKVGSEKNVTQIVRETEDGPAIYEVTFKTDGKMSEVEISETGDVMEITNFIDAAALPIAAAAAIKKAFPKGSIKETESVQVFLYEVVVNSDGEDHEVIVTATGQMDDDDEDGDEDENGDDDDEDDNDDDGDDR